VIHRVLACGVISLPVLNSSGNNLPAGTVNACVHFHFYKAMYTAKLPQMDIFLTDIISCDRLKLCTQNEILGTPLPCCEKILTFF